MADTIKKNDKVKAEDIAKSATVTSKGSQAMVESVSSVVSSLAQKHDETEAAAKKALENAHITVTGETITTVVEPYFKTCLLYTSIIRYVGNVMTIQIECNCLSRRNHHIFFQILQQCDRYFIRSGDCFFYRVVILIPIPNLYSTCFLSSWSLCSIYSCLLYTSLHNLYPVLHV